MAHAPTSIPRSKRAPRKAERGTRAAKRAHAPENAIDVVRGLSHPLAAEVVSLADGLAEHPLFTSLRTPAHLRTFMEHHVWAVWDFMSLLKSVQTVFAPSEPPWVPSRDADAARLIGEIVVDEEADEGPDGARASHFETYLGAMAETGADTQPVRGFVAALRALGSWETEIDRAPPAARDFVRTTMGFAAAAPWVRVAALAIGREAVIPSQFHPLAVRLAGVPRSARLRWYLERHLQVDGLRHGPLAARLFERTCLCAPEKADESLAAAVAALRARADLWDAVLAQVSDRRGAGAAASSRTRRRSAAPT